MLCLTLFILPVALVMADGAQPDAVLQRELQQFQGTWKAVAIQLSGGGQASAAEVQGTRLRVKGNHFTLISKDSTISGTFTINPAADPRTIDAVIISTDGTRMVFRGIYQIQADLRRSCFALPEEDRPRQFSSAKGQFGFVWKRNQAAQPASIWAQKLSKRG